MNLIFYKDEFSRWYINLPEYKGPKEDLEMVLGSDNLLDILSNGEDYVVLITSLEYKDNMHRMEFNRETIEWNNGAYYRVITNQGNDIGHIWLCDVTKFVFGGFPSVIYFI